MDWRESPTFAELHRLSRLLAALDIVCCYENPDIRYFYFTPEVAKGVDSVRLDNGAGDYAVGVFGPEGVIIKAFDHESKLSPYARKDHLPWPGMYGGVPEKLLAYLDLADLDKNDVTYCTYRLPVGPWIETRLEKPLPTKFAGSGSWLLSQFHDTPKDWVDWAKDYYEARFDLKDVAEVYATGRITAELAARLVKNLPHESPLDFQTIRPDLINLDIDVS